MLDKKFAVTEKSCNFDNERINLKNKRYYDYHI